MPEQELIPAEAKELIIGVIYKYLPPNYWGQLTVNIPDPLIDGKGADSIKVNENWTSRIQFARPKRKKVLNGTRSGVQEH